MWGQYQIHVDVEHAVERDKGDADVCLRMAEIRIFVPVYSSRNSLVISGVDLEAQLATLAEWIEKHERAVPVST